MSYFVTQLKTWIQKRFFIGLLLLYWISAVSSGPPWDFIRGLFMLSFLISAPAFCFQNAVKRLSPHDFLWWFGVILGIMILALNLMLLFIYANNMQV
jgi:hypothetical protein